MTQFELFVIICYVNSVCKANPIMYFKISKNEVIPLKNELMITSTEATVQIMVDEILPAESHDVVTLDQLICYNNKTNHIIFSNLNFAYVTKYLTTNYTQYRYISTQELKTLRDSSVAWQWLCKLYAQWDGSNVDYEFEVKVEMLGKNETNNSTSKDTDEKIPLHEQQLSGETKLLTKNIKHTDRLTTDLNEDVGAGKNYLDSTEKIISNKNPEKGKENQSTQPKSISIGNTEQAPRDQKGINQRHIEKNDGMEMDTGVIPPNTLQNGNNANSETSISTTLVIVVASVVIFIVGLVIGAICRRPPTTASAPAPSEKADDQTNEHIYEEVVDKGIQNRPPLPVPEEAVTIYSSPYDHNRWFQNQSALN